MWSRMVPVLAACAVAAWAFPTSAQGFHRVDPYGVASEGYAGDYGYAGAFVRGSYIGAPLTHVPRPAQLVPTPWSYGTYGVPTVSGIPPAPAGHPTLTVINARGSLVAPRRGDARADGDAVAGVRIIEVQVPRR